MNNVKIAYALSFIFKSWFWLGCWVLYYLRFTDYAGIGLLEAVMITTSTLGEIPTGAIADILGKRKAVILAFLLGSIGHLVMAFAPNFNILFLSIIVMSLGGTFYSGSLEALVYDSLKDEGKTDLYKTVIGRITTMQNLGMATAGIVGGFLYKINVSLPFLMVSMIYIIGILLSFKLKEPKIDSEKYSWKQFVLQNKEGFNQLFCNRQMAYLSLLFLIPSAFMLATENVINDATAIQLGFDSVQLGIFATVLYLCGILASEKSGWIIDKFKSKQIYILMIVIYFVTLITMPKAGIIVGAILLLIRYAAATIFGNYESIRLNEVIESRHRATTLSTFNLLRNIPYVFTATIIGVIMNIYTPKVFSLYFGIIFIIFVVLIYLAKPIFRTKNNE